MTKENWKDVHEDFTEKLQKGWENNNFTYEQVKEWKEVLGWQFKPIDYFFCSWLRDIKKLTPQKVDYEYKNMLEEEYDALWENIHKDFFLREKNKWEEQGFDYKETKEWIYADLKPQEVNFANYLKQNDYQPKQLTTDKLFELRKEFYLGYPNAQVYLDKNYSAEIRKDTRIINLCNLNLEGDLDLEGFSDLSLSRINLAGNPRLGEIKNKPYGTILIYQNPQEYQHRQYSDKDWVTGIDFRCLEFEEPSELVIDDYPNLKGIDGYGTLKITKLTISNCPQLEHVVIIQFEDNQELILTNLPNLKILNCDRNKLTILNLINCSHLEMLNCKNNKLTGLDLTNFSNLQTIDCWNNLLMQIKLPNSGEYLERLVLSNNNFPEQDLSFLSHLVNLKELKLGNGSEDPRKVELNIHNKFVGSLEPLQKLSKLEELSIENTDIDRGLEYLSESIKKFGCSTDTWEDAKCKKIEQELRRFGEPTSSYNFAPLLKNWKESYQAQQQIQQLNKPSKRGWKTNLEGIDIAPFIPSNKEINLQENNHLKEPITYQKIEKLESKTNQWKTPPQELLPIKLYNIEKDQVEWTKDNPNIKNYAIASYVWGQPGKVESDIWNTQYKDKLNPAGYKSLYKAIQACKHLGINYLWMDQLCIDQTSTAEKNQEVPKMRQYYSNATTTLIPVQCKLEKNDAIDTIANSEWFKRSWTFQEGWLSKHTIFMFDDHLIDGRDLAVEWVWKQPSYSEYAKINPSEKDEASVKVATPIGWVYFKDGYNSEDKISLTLSQVLRGIRERNRTLSIDGVYSVLGLLPYGEKVIPKYKEWGYQYTQTELLEALYDVMKTAWENGYGEVLAWHGEGFDLIPKIKSVSHGSASVAGGIFVKRKSDLENVLNLTEKGIEINASEYVIENVNEELSEIEKGEGFLIDGGLCARNVQVKVDDQLEEIKLWGAKETLEKINKEYSLIIPSPNEWESNIPFALLAEKKGEVYQRVGLVELRTNSEKLQGVEEKKLIISMNDYNRAKRIVRKQTILEPQLIKETEKEATNQLLTTTEQISLLCQIQAKLTELKLRKISDQEHLEYLKNFLNIQTDLTKLSPELFPFLENQLKEIKEKITNEFNMTEQELQNLLDKQKNLIELEKELVDLKEQEQQTQIIQTNFPNK